MEPESHPRHQHSASSDHGRSLVPMWDSSDPERAPPPLPLNPQSPSLSSRPGTSTAIQSAHAALTERARESALVTTALAKRLSEVSPERSPTRASSHRRMQSLQPGTVRDLGFHLEGPRHSNGPSSSGDKIGSPSTPSRSREKQEERAGEREPRSASSTPVPGPSLTPIVRPVVRRPHQSILGENTPPQSATMLALQNMPSGQPKEPDAPPLSVVTNGSNALVRAPQSFENLSAQILTLTSIATSLQKEMNQLSRRSRDNATDLMSLKEATNARDEDIRKSLRELLASSGEVQAPGRLTGRESWSGGYLLDSKPHSSSPLGQRSAVRPFSLPRIPSPTSFAASLDRESTSTPSLYAGDSSATAGALDKIMREMGTKEGQEEIVSYLLDVTKKLSKVASADKVDEVLDLVRNHWEQALVPMAPGSSGPPGPGSPGRGTRDFGSSGADRRLAFEPDAAGSGPMTRRVERLLNNRDDRRSSEPLSVSSNLANDDVLKIVRSVKDSVAQGGGLTAEVKALVRELRGEVLGMGRELGRKLDQAAATRDVQSESGSGKDDVAQIIDEGLSKMKEQLNHILREHRRQSAPSAAPSAPKIDYQGIYNAIHAGLRESNASLSAHLDTAKEDILDAVRESWEAYRPNSETHSLGLDRDEVLECLKEGLDDHLSHSAGATRDEVFQAVVEGLKHFVPPRLDVPPSLSRDEILEAVRECLEEFEFPVAASAINADVSRDDVISAVRQGLSEANLGEGHGAASSEARFEEFSAQLREFMDMVQDQFKAVSDEAKQNVAANGRDTEQVLDATKDGFERLRSEIESYVDRVNTGASHEEFMSNITGALEGFKNDLAGTVAAATAPRSSDLDSDAPAWDAVQAELSELKDAVVQLAAARASQDGAGPSLEEVVSALGEVQADIRAMRDHKQQDGAVATLDDGAVIPAEVLKHDDIKNLEVLIAQLRIKVEAMEPEPQAASRDDFARVEETLRNVQETLQNSNSHRGNSPSPGDGATREDVVAIETILRNTKARLDDLIDGEQAVRKEHLDALEVSVLEIGETINSVAAQLPDVARADQLAGLEALVSGVSQTMEELKEQVAKEAEDPERVRKSDAEAIEALCLEIKDCLGTTDMATLSSKEDIAAVETLVKEAKGLFERQIECSSKALEERQAENVGLGERVSDLKILVEEVREAMQGKLQEGLSGIETLGSVLAGLGTTMEGNATVGQDVKEMFETMKTEFDESKAGVVGAKLEADAKFQETTDLLSCKIDEKMDGLGARMDEMAAGLEEGMKSGEARGLETEAAVNGTKAVAEELKSLIDTLGAAVTESLEKMEEASKTVFERVEDLVTKSDESLADGKAEHEQTRGQVKQAADAIQSLQSQVSDYEPQILEAVKDVLLVVGQHYEHSKSAADSLTEKMEEAKAQAEPPLLPPAEKYDDSGVHEKLDRLAEHGQSTEAAFSRLNRLDKLDKLDEMHKVVEKTAAELTGFLADRTREIAQEHEDREQQLLAATVSLERRNTEMTEAEASINRLRSEEERARIAVEELRAEEKEMERKRARLAADVSSFETALRLRREELQEMEARAEALERRLMEGAMNQSRLLLLARSRESADVMSRKRKPKKATAAAAAAAAAEAGPRAPGRPANALMMPKRSPAPPPSSGAARRIVSLGQMTNNAAGGVARSQSLKASASPVRSLRKGSWGGSFDGSFDRDKENRTIQDIEEESLAAETPLSADRQLAPYVAPGSLARGGDAAAAGEPGSRRGSVAGTASEYTEYTEDCVTETEYAGTEDDDRTFSEWTECTAEGDASAVGTAGGEGEGDIVLFGS